MFSLLVLSFFLSLSRYWGLCSASLAIHLMLSLKLILTSLSTLCWIVALIPQQWHNYRYKSVDGLSPYLLLLWFLGDSTNLLGCILTNQLPFQTYISIYFVFNDFILDFQYLYYKKFSASHNIKIDPLYGENIPETDSVVELITDNTFASTNDNDVLNNNKPFLGSSLLSKNKIITVTTALLSVSPGSCMPIISKNSKLSPNSFQSISIGTFVAWLCTFIYCSSRLPQLYHNYIRKSVDGVSPLLFTFALLANLTYALSILVSDVPKDLTYEQFIMNELPYLLGSLGTVLFDGVYFLQRKIYKRI